MSRIQKVVLHHWGYKNQQFNVDRLVIHHRPRTTDEKVINEVLVKHAYQKRSIGFMIESDDCWLDLGANIGTFSLLALSVGARVVAVEPEPENLELLKMNLEENFPAKDTVGAVGSWRIIGRAVVNELRSVRYAHAKGAQRPERSELVKLYLCNGDYNKYRHTLYHKRGRESIEVLAISIRELLERYPDIDAVKMDIEGTEIDLLESMTADDFKNINKLVFEYSFDFDPSIPRFMNIINTLRKTFDNVHFTKVDETQATYKYFPPCTNVFCWND